MSIIIPLHPFNINLVNLWQVLILKFLLPLSALTL